MIDPIININAILDYIDGKTSEKVAPTNIGSVLIVQEKGVKSGKYTPEEAEAWYLKICGPRELLPAGKLKMQKHYAEM